MRDYQEHEVVAQLRRKADLDIDGKIIRELRRFAEEKDSHPAKGDVGIKSKGKIDFLVKYCGYTHYYVNKFKNR